MIDWFERSRSARISSRGRAERAAGAAILEERPQPLADRRRQHAFEILERRASQVLVVGVQAAKRDLQRLARQHQRQQREDVGQALAGAVPHELVDERRRRPARRARRAAGGFPRPDGRPPTSRRPPRRCASLSMRTRGFFSRIARQRPAALEPHLEPQVVEAEHQAVGGALRHADREHARQPAADGELLVRIDQRVDELRRPAPRPPCAARTPRRRRPDPRPAAG